MICSLARHPRRARLAGGGGRLARSRRTRARSDRQPEPAPERGRADRSRRLLQPVGPHGFRRGRRALPQHGRERANPAGGHGLARHAACLAYRPRSPDRIDYYELSDIFSRGAGRRLRELFPPEGEITYPGIGIVPRTLDGKTFVAEVYDGSPAASACVKPGDEILGVDGAPYAEIASFSGKVGKTATLQLRRAPEAAPTLARRPGAGACNRTRLSRTRSAPARASSRPATAASAICASGALRGRAWRRR